MIIKVPKKATETTVNGNKAYVHPDHSSAVTRRHLFLAGLTSGMGCMMVPNKLLRLITPQILSAMGAGGSPTAYLEYAPQGGGFCANAFIASGLTAGGVYPNGTMTPLSGSGAEAAYANIGWAATPTTANTNFQLGLGLNTNDPFFNTLFNTTASSNGKGNPATGGSFAGLSAKAIAGLTGVSTHYVSTDDSNGNIFSIASLVMAGMTQLIGQSTVSALGFGGGASSSQGDFISVGGGTYQAFNPIRVQTAANVQSSISLGFPTSYSQAQQGDLIKGTQGLAGLFGNQISNFLNSSSYSSLFGSANSNNVSSFQAAANPANFDPTQDPTSTSVWATNGSILAGDLTLATLTYNLLGSTSRAGNTYSAVYTPTGSFDYHDTGVANVQSKHQQIAADVGRVLNHAALLGRKIVVQIATDGSTNGSMSGIQYNPSGDTEGNHGAALLLFFDPSTVKSGSTWSSLINGAATNTQLGGLAANGTTDRTPFFANNTSFAAAIQLANYFNTMSGGAAVYAQLAEALNLPTAAQVAPYLALQGT